MRSSAKWLGMAVAWVWFAGQAQVERIWLTPAASVLNEIQVHWQTKAPGPTWLEYEPDDQWLSIRSYQVSPCHPSCSDTLGNIRGRPTIWR